jgi:hypothetical protein
VPDSHIWFAWQASKTGYCWWEDWQPGQELRVVGYLRSDARQGLIEGDRYLVANAEFEEAPSMTACSPLEATGLFRDFAALKPCDGEIREFANRNGLLTDGRLVIAGDDAGDDDADFPGEPLSVWTQEIARMSFLLQLWELVENKDKRGLAQYIEWTEIFGHRGFRFKDPQDRFPARDILGAPWLAQVLRQRDVLTPAQFILDSLVTEQVSGQIDHAIFRDVRHRPSLRCVPRDLRTALWLQFAGAIEGSKEYQQCDECQTWFEIGSRQGGRSDKRFCSTACRARNWRKTRSTADKSAERTPFKQ